MCPAHDWNAKSQDRMEIAGFCECLAGKAFPQDTRETVCFVILSYLLHYILIHTIYTIITQMLRSASERKPYPQTLRVRDCYTHNSLRKLLVDFLQLLPLNFHTTERLITQTLTIPFQSVQ